jgi:hypothetical protein
VGNNHCIYCTERTHSLKHLLDVSLSAEYGISTNETHYFNIYLSKDVSVAIVWGVYEHTRDKIGCSVSFISLINPTFVIE